MSYRIRTELVPSWSCLQGVSKPIWRIPLLCLQWKTSDDGQRNCPKQVDFYSKNKFENLVHLLGFIIRIYHDARSPARQIHLQYTGVRVNPSSPPFFAQYMIKDKGWNTPIQATSAILTLCNTVTHIERWKYACCILLYTAGRFHFD